MGCPIHVWVPMMAGLAPVARIARDRWRVRRDLRHAQAEERPRELKRWAPVDPNAQRPARSD